MRPLLLGSDFVKSRKEIWFLPHLYFGLKYTIAIDPNHFLIQKRFKVSTEKFMLG